MKHIEIHFAKIIELCKRYKVKTLSIFGSILTNRFNEKSDIDFLVDFLPANPDVFDYVSNYFNLKDDLERLLQRRVDLIEDGEDLNPLFKASIDQKKQVIYG